MFHFYANDQVISIQDYFTDDFTENGLYRKNMAG